MLQNGVEGLVLAASEQCLQGLYVADGVPQDLHFGQPLVRVGTCAALQRFEGLVDFAEPPPLTQRRRLTSVCVGRLPLAGLAGPEETAARLMVPDGCTDVLVVLRLGVMMDVLKGRWGRGR